MTRERWIGIIVGLITAIVTLILLALLEQREASSRIAYDCVDPTERERIRDISLRGIDDGLQQAMTHLYDIWVKDNSEQPARARVGTTNAINAHNRARKFALAWDPPTCPTEKP